MDDNGMGDMLVKLATICNKLSNPDYIKKLNPDTLSYIASRLSAMKASLVDMKVDAEFTKNMLEIDRDEAKAKAYAKYKEKHGATAAKDMKYEDKEYIEIRVSYIEAKRDYERLRSITADAHDLIESLVNRTIVLSQSMKDERLT